jgi:peroxiredoxin
VIGVSADSQETSDSFCESLRLPFPLVGDPQGHLLRAYKVRWPVIGMAQRVTYVIGKDRKIRMAWHDERDVEEHVRRAGQALGVEA